MADFFSSRFLRLLTVPARSRVVNMASRPFYNIADRILGSQFLEDIAEFFLLFQSMYDGFVERANAVTRVLGDRRTTFVVVSTLESAPVREAEFFIDELRRRKLHLGAIVLNKVLPETLRDRDATASAKRLANDAPTVAKAVLEAVPQLADERMLERVLREIGESFLNFQVVATREAETMAELAETPDVVATVPYFDSDIYDLQGLLRLGERLWR
jgi:anion-transporting  ArsA/GET3 family ATPase